MSTAIRYVFSSKRPSMPLNELIHSLMLGHKMPAGKTVEDAFEEVVQSLGRSGIVRCGTVPENVQADLARIKKERLDFNALFTKERLVITPSLLHFFSYKIFLGILYKGLLRGSWPQRSEDTARDKENALQNSLSDLAFISAQAVWRPIDLRKLHPFISLPIAKHTPWNQPVIKPSWKNPSRPHQKTLNQRREATIHTTCNTTLSDVRINKNNS